MDLTHREAYSRQIQLNSISFENILYFVSAFHLQAYLPAVLSVLNVLTYMCYYSTSIRLQINYLIDLRSRTQYVFSLECFKCCRCRKKCIC
jgi:hypothetical protein